MQNKGFVKVFSVLLTLVCLFYLSFSFVTAHYNNKAAEYAQGDPEKESFYLDSLATKKVWPGLSFWPGYSLKECREMEITLGLDLKGGMNVILELNVSEVILALSNNNRDENFNKALELAYKRQSTSQSDFIDLFAEEYKKLDPQAQLAAIFSTFDLRDKISPQSSDQQVISVLKGELKSAIDNSFNVLRTRIDRFGVVSPNIQRLETTGRILVELPGVKETERVRRLLQASANLEFWETYSLPEVMQELIAVNSLLASFETQNAPETDSPAETTEQPAEEVADPALNPADSLLAQLNDSTALPTTQSQEEAAKQNPLFSRLMPMISENGQPYPGPTIGQALTTDMKKIDELLATKQVRDLLPRNLIFKWGVKPVTVNRGGQTYELNELYAVKQTNRDGSPALGGEVVTDATADFAQDQLGRGSNRQEVTMIMNAEGAKAWARLTKDNVGKAIAIVLDNMVYSAPNVIGEIPGGRSQITGSYTPEEAKDLANVLKSGKMAASINIVQEDVVGPSLGQAAINAGVISFIVALIILMAYMCIVYGVLPGMIANGALIINIFFTMGVLASFQAVLTLPGIAGMVLTLAMAIDANVLIYERIREELRSGKGLAKAVSDGYSNAFSAIFDANLTSIITSIVLFYFGTGPIRGFATTLIIGLCSSFLTAVFLTRIIYEALLAKDKIKNLTFSTSISKNFLLDPKFNFLGKRKVGYIIPVALIFIGAVSLFTQSVTTGR